MGEQMKRFLAVTVLLFMAGSVSLAASRTWKSSNGRFSIKAELVDFKDGKAELKKSDGKTIEVPLLSLCDEDQKFVKEQFPGAEEEKFRPGAEYRQWKSRTGNFSTLAEFLGFSDGSVQLRKPDGTELSVEKKLLSAADQRWVADELRRLHEEEKEQEKADDKEKGDAKAGKSGGQEVAGQIGEQDIAMKLVRIDQPQGKGRGKGGVPADYIFRLLAPQQFYAQLSNRGAANQSEFTSLVQKEPRYNSSLPFRGVARLGSHQYCFALDTTGPQAGVYSKLYFDINANGDLTDDRPIAAASTATPNPTMAQSHFPRVDMKIDIDGKSVDYSFVLSAICNKSPTGGYATVSLYSAAVREGSLAQGSKRTKLLLVDRNSNGRFDDTISLQGGSGGVEGDLLLVNPNPKNKLSADAAMGGDRYFVSKTICLGKSFYRMEIPASGESLKMTPVQLSMGNITNPSPAYRAVLFCEDYGALMLAGVKDQKIPLPEGTWKVVNYAIDGGGRGTMAAARFQGEGSAVTVAKGETAKLSFGAPFHGEVTARRQNDGKVSLSLAIVGVAGEHCTNFYVNGSRPPRPRFMIKDKDDKVVHQGSFEYG
jgi:hypothetical protein